VTRTDNKAEILSRHDNPSKKSQQRKANKEKPTKERQPRTSRIGTNLT
jgi:hypothetical protein